MLLAVTSLVPFDWHRILWTPRTPPAYLGEIVFRCVVMYFIIIIALRVTGRRGVRQLSIFEISLVLALGSAAGDTMFYGTTSLLYAAVVFVVVTGLYWLFNLLTRRYPRLSDWLEGKPVLLIEDGRIKLENFRQLRLTQKELFGELRQHQVEHLGQVRLAYMEATGSLSVYFYPTADPVLAGLPIRPEHCERRLRRADVAGPYACYCCGRVQQLPPPPPPAPSASAMSGRPRAPPNGPARPRQLRRADARPAALRPSPARTFAALPLAPMKALSPPVLALAAFPQARTPYYAERLRAHVERFPHVNAPHGHSFYLLLYVREGTGTHTVDLVTYELRPGSVFFLAPGQVHQWHLGPDADGIVVFFEPDFYQFRYPERDLLALPFFDTTHSPALYLPADNELSSLFEKLLHEYQTTSPNQAEVLRAYLALILEIATRHYPAAPASTEAGLAQSQLRQFGALLNQHYRTRRGVRDYAALLHLTANYLNALCRRVLGQTASDLIHARVVLEARRLLTHSALSVAQVADKLGFDDPSYFGRYFRKYVGQSPEAFRQNGKLS